MKNMYRAAIIFFAGLCVVSSKIIPSNLKINSEILSIEELGNVIEMDRISPKSKVQYNTVSIDENNLSSQDIRRRVTRDTLLNLYRQKELYKNLNRNLYESYFQSSINDGRGKFNQAIRSDSNDLNRASAGSASGNNNSNNNNNNSQISFKKLNVNPYKDLVYKQPTNRQIYKKHPGFRVTDSVDHLKYLVDRNSNKNVQNVQPTNLDGDSQRELLSKIIGSNEASRQRRGEFYHTRNLSENEKEVIRRLKEEVLRSNLRSRQTVACPSRNARCLNYYRKKNRMRRRSFSSM